MSDTVSDTEIGGRLRRAKELRDAAQVEYRAAIESAIEAGWPQTRVAMELDVSKAAVNRMVARIARGVPEYQ